MGFRKECTIVVMAVVVLLAVGINPGHSQPAFPSCNSLLNLDEVYRDEQLGQLISITSAVTITAGTGSPYCDVRGTIEPDIGFNIKLPIANWNQRFYMTGSTGSDGGTINEDGMATALSRGFATAGSNTGHTFTLDPFSWAYNPLPANTNPDAIQKKYDFYFRANHETAVLAKNIIGAYYGSGSPLLYSYFEGASDGGRQALVEAQLYPQDFDGIIAAYPVMNCAWGNVRYIWNRQARDVADISSNELQNIAETVYNKCDSIDGLVDGIIDDPRKCPVNPDTDFSGVTAQQIETIKKIYQGPRTTDGTQIYPGTPFGSEITDAQGLRGWQQYGPILPMPVFGEVLINDAKGFLKNMAFEPPVNPLTYDYTTFNIDSDLGNMANTGAWCSAEDPNLLPFKSAGGKLIQWHGYADAVTSPLASINYYENVLENLGAVETKSFYKLYMVPGAFNGGGIGCSDIDWLSVVQQWVENDEFEPGTIIGTRPAGGGYSFRTRPVCPYPQVARYLGTGSIDDALNFRCVNIVPSSVQIKPDRIKLGSRGTFKATLTLPAGYDARNFSQVATTCEGAPGEKVKVGKKGSVVKAKFNKEDVQNITPEKDVMFTVTAIYEQGGQLFAFEGSQSIHVID
jgi:feruloyl esterase